MIDGYLTVTEAAERVGVNTETVRRWCTVHGMPHERVQLRGIRMYAIRAADLDAFAATWPERKAAILAEGRRTWRNVPAVLPSARAEALRRFRAAKMAQEDGR